LESRELLSITAIPQPDHVLVVIEENHAYGQIIGSSAAPYINSLAQNGALFTQSFAITHPSQPNYLQLFSGSNQGVTTDNCPTQPFNTLNLGASLLQAGYTFAGYSEGLPAIGSTACTSGAYARKHNPWVDWQGAATNAIPASANLRFSDFPTDFSTLPTVSFVIPNQDNDMHNGTDPATITRGDNWLRTNLDAYVQWVNAHNSLFIVTFDEDNGSSGNHIATFFYGPMVTPGQYSTRITHYTLLRTLEDMYGLPYAGATATPITYVWSNPWSEADIGAVGTAGSAFVYADSVYTVQGAGAGIGGTADALHFVYQSFSGNGSILAQVTSVADTDPGALAGVMIRAGLTPDSAQALMALTPGNGAQYVGRNAMGGDSTVVPGSAVTAPYWVYLTCSGDTFTGYTSSDGVNFDLVNQQTISMAPDVYIGLAVSSNNDPVLNTAMFANVSIMAGGGGGGGAAGSQAEPGIPVPVRHSGEKSGDAMALLLASTGPFNLPGPLLNSMTSRQEESRMQLDGPEPAAEAVVPGIRRGLANAAQRIEEPYMNALCRKPRAEETTRLVKYVDSGATTGDLKKALADVFWALLNSSEFMLNH
jgi:acid phosphatase